MNTAEDIVGDKQREIVSISWDHTVQEACREMVDRKIGAILVEMDHQLKQVNAFVTWDYYEN